MSLDFFRQKEIICSFSGGKDSTALLLFLLHEIKPKKLVAVFADTGWEHDITYEYIEKISKTVYPIVTVFRDSFVNMCKHKKRFPSSGARFCTEWLKLHPIREYIRTQIDIGNIDPENSIMACGIRAEESHKRSAMEEFVETDDYFKLPQWRPLHQWTWQQVFDIHKKYNIEPNPLYKEGMRRVGCMPCIMSSHAELSQIVDRLPEVFDKISKAEATLSEVTDHASFWGHGDIPEKFCSRRWKHPKTGIEYRIPSAEDVKKYVKMTKVQKKYGCSEQLFEDFDKAETWGTCSSIYGLCE